MILNLLRVEALKVEDMIRRSFSENAAQRLLPDQQKKVAESEKELGHFGDLADVPDIDDLRKFYDSSRKLVHYNQRVLFGAYGHPSANKVFTTGRVVILRDGVSLIAPLWFQTRLNLCTAILRLFSNLAQTCIHVHGRGFGAIGRPAQCQAMDRSRLLAQGHPRMPG